MEQKVIFSTRLKEAMDDKGYRQVDLLEEVKKLENKFKVNFGKSHISQYCAGKNIPDNRRMLALSEVLGVTEPWLSGYDYPKIVNWDDIKLAKDITDIQFELKLMEKFDNEGVMLLDNYGKLNKNNRDNLVKYSQLLVRESKYMDYGDYNVVYVTEKVSAGTGYKYCNEGDYPVKTDRTDLHDYDYATVITGDSMEPLLHDGDVILVKQGYDNVNGDIYVIDYNGESYVKKLYNDGDRFRLVSINDNYDNIIIHMPTDSYFNIVGKVVDSFTPMN